MDPVLEAAVGLVGEGVLLEGAVVELVQAGVVPQGDEELHRVPEDREVPGLVPEQLVHLGEIPDTVEAVEVVLQPRGLPGRADEGGAVEGLVAADVVAANGEDGVHVVLVAEAEEDVLHGGARCLVDLEETDLLVRLA